MAAPAEEAPAYVDGAQAAPLALTQQEEILQILHWIGFTRDGQKNNIYADSIGSYNDFYALNSEDIDSMAKDYSGRTATNGKMNFGIRRIKRLKSAIHWAQDHRRVSSTPSIKGMNGDDFLAQLERASERAKIRGQHKSDADTKAKEASPGPLKSEKEWMDWEAKFTNYLSVLIGVNGVPLNYVIRENEAPPAAGSKVYANFMDETIYCAPLSGTYYDADKQTVHQAIVSFTTGNPSEDWIKSVSRHRDGRRSMKALRDHFAGEGNATRRIAEADRLKNSLHYKNERSLSFETFLTKCQRMFNIYEKEGEPMPDDAKLRFLFEKIQHAGLQTQIEALRASITTGTAVSYVTAANHLSTAVSQLPEYVAKSRVIGATGTTEGGDGIRRADGSIIANAWLPNWDDLSKEDRAKVLAERRRLGIRLGRGGKEGGGGGDQQKNKNSKAFNKLKRQNKKYQRQIKALKRDGGGNNDDNQGSENEEEQDAGDSFGGRRSKRNRTNNNE